MKRTFVFTVVMAFFLLVLTPRAYASTDKAFTTVRLNKFGSVAIILGNKFGFDIGGFIVPFFTKEKEMATPDFYPGADFKGSISKYTMPQSKMDLNKIIPWNEQANPVKPTALYGAILKTDADHSNHPPPTDCYISQGLETSVALPNAPGHFWTGQFINAFYGIREISPKDESGIIDFNRPNVALAGMNAGEDCKKHDPGIDREKVETGLTKLSQFGQGTMIEGEEMTTIMKIIEFFNRKTGEMDTKEVPETEPHKDDVFLTKDQKLPGFNFMCNDYWCPGNEVGDDSSHADTQGGWTNFLLPLKDQGKVLAASLQPYLITVLGFPQKPLLASYDAFNQSQVGMQKAGCYATPYTPENNPQADAALGGLIKIQEQCEPKTQQCKVDSWEEILQKLPGAINAVCEKYKNSLPISTTQCSAMMNEIFNIEIRNDPEWSGANYRCERRSDSSAAGPFQIIDESYSIVACSEEELSDDLSGCKTKEQQLSRCITEDATEMAMRVILNFSDCNSAGSLTTTGDLYRRVCEYGTGVCVPLPHLGNKTYCEHVFDVAGIAKPPNTCTAPTP